MGARRVFRQLKSSGSRCSAPIFLILAATVVEASAQTAGPLRLNAVAFIEATGTAGIAAPGSGVLISSEGYILTSRHVARPPNGESAATRLVVTLGDRSTRYAAREIQCMAGEVDLCLIKITRSDVVDSGVTEFFVPECRVVDQLESIVALGYVGASPYGSVIAVPGYVVGEIGEFLQYPSNVAIVPGMSGGPVLDTSYRVIALNTGARLGIPALTFLQPLSYAVTLLQLASVPCPQSN